MIRRAIFDIAEFKALPGDQRGRFEALVAVFDNVDGQGDRVLDGAFQKSLQEWRLSGAPIPVIWQHQWQNPNAHIGFADPHEVREIPGRGLKMAGSIDLDNPFGAQVYKLMKERRVKEFSFGYEVKSERRGKDGANELVELRLIEAGPTLRGANPSTELLAVKSALERAAAAPVVDEATRRYIDTKLAKLGVERARARFDEADAIGKATVDPEILAISARLAGLKKWLAPPGVETTTASLKAQIEELKRFCNRG